MNAQHNFSFVRLLKNLKLFYFVKLLFQSFCKTYIKDFYFCQKGSKMSANIRNLRKTQLPADRPDAATRLSTAGLTFMQAGLHSDRLDEVGGARLLRQVDNKPDRETNCENIFPPHHSPLGSYWQISHLRIFRWLPTCLPNRFYHIKFSDHKLPLCSDLFKYKTYSISDLHSLCFVRAFLG